MNETIRKAMKYLKKELPSAKFARVSNAMKNFYTNYSTSSPKGVIVRGMAKSAKKFFGRKK